MSLFEIAGWIGVALLIIAYFLLSTERVKNSYLFQWLNIVGAFGLLLAALEKDNYPTVGLEIVWMLIGAYAIFKLFRQNRKDGPA